MNKKGFTLMEIMTVIIILAVIATISFPLINNLMKQSKQSLYETQIKLVEDAARKMTLEDTSLLDKNTSSCIDIESIIKSGQIDSDEIIDPRNNEPITGSVVVTFDSDYNQYDYKYSSDPCSN